MINHLVNDAIVMGAKPLAVLDVIITGGINETTINTIVKEIAAACRNNECSLVGGETSIQPGIVNDDLCILSSSIIGIVDKTKIIDGGNICEGDCVLAIASNGLHTNGYTMARKLIDMNSNILNNEIFNGRTFLQCIMEPHTAYYPIIKNFIQIELVHGMAHITGGGIEGNLCRIMPEHLMAHIDLSKIITLPVFKYIKNLGKIDDQEMLSTFNCGVGLVMVVPSVHKEAIIKGISESMLCYEIGKIEKTKGDTRVLFQNNLNWMDKEYGF